MERLPELDTEVGPKPLDRLTDSAGRRQGAERADHATFTIATDMPIYFCDPYSPKLRGSNENTYGRLRPFLIRTLSFSRLISATLLFYNSFDQAQRCEGLDRTTQFIIERWNAARLDDKL